MRRLVGANFPADVLLVQDFPRRAVRFLECAAFPFYSFASMTIHRINGVQGFGETDVGVGLFSKYPITNIIQVPTWGNGELKPLQGVNESSQRHLGEESDRLVEASEDRWLIVANVMKGYDDPYPIATTHGMWVRNGVINDVQRESTRRLIAALQSEAQWRHGLVFAGDLNISRENEIYQMITGAGFRDCIPDSIESTLDPEHPFSKKGGKVVSDYFMEKGGYTFRDIELVAGVSDHCALMGTVGHP